VLGFGVLGIASILNPPTKQAPLWDQLTNAPYYLGYVYIVLVSVSGLLSFIAIVAIVYGAYKAKRLSPLDAIH
jgi:ABC-type antimicrobial peptide transport system permease subunit